MYFPKSDIRLPFQHEGTISYLPTCGPLKVELKEYEGKYMLLTLNTPESDPHKTIYRDQKHAMVEYKGHIKENGDTQSKSDNRISAVINRSALDISSDSTLFETSVSSLDSGEMNVSGVKSSSQKRRVSAKELSERLKIPLYVAQKKTRQLLNWQS